MTEQTREILNSLSSLYPLKDYEEQAIDEVLDAAKQPGRIKGHWIEIALSNHTHKCSVCGRLLVNITDGKNNVAKNYPYCHCGADMREVTS